MEVIDEDKFVKLRADIVNNPLMGEALHALANLPGCPNCHSSSHQLSIKSLIEGIAARCRERGDIPEELLTPGNWMYDMRRCPLYITIYNKHLRDYEFLAYNHLRSVAIDAIYRDFLRAQGVGLTPPLISLVLMLTYLQWHIKTPLPQMEDHFHRKARRFTQEVKPILPPYEFARDVLSGDQEYPRKWIAYSQENDFFTWT